MDVEIITYIQNLKYDINEPIYKAETDSQRTDLQLPRGRGEEKGMNWEFRAGIQTIIFRMERQ